MASKAVNKSSRTTVRRNPRRAVYDKETIHAILDEAILCHLAVNVDGEPRVLPTIHTRIGDRLYFHGSSHNHLLNLLASGEPACVSVTVLDGLVLARSALHHSMNYRSVVLYGKGEEVTCEEEKRNALQALVEQIVPGRWDDCRQPDDKELAATLVIALSIDEASAKVRSGAPIDDARDMELPHWAGEIPVKLCSFEQISDANGNPEPVPDYVNDYSKLPRAVLE